MNRYEFARLRTMLWKPEERCQKKTKLFEHWLGCLSFYQAISKKILLHTWYGFLGVLCGFFFLGIDNRKKSGWRKMERHQIILHNIRYVSHKPCFEIKLFWVKILSYHALGIWKGRMTLRETCEPIEIRVPWNLRQPLFFFF